MREAGLDDPLQLDPPRRDPDADLGADARHAAMLASDEASHITGTEIAIGGGLLAGSVASPG